MDAIGIDYRSGKGVMLVHRCVRCGHRRLNRAALDDLRQPDDLVAIAALSLL
jgi:hypothetical protein